LSQLESCVYAKPLSAELQISPLANFGQQMCN
jgi:hypothetical protein